MPLPADYDALLVDMDGVMWLGGELIPGSVEAIASQLATGTQIVFVTNDSRTAAAAHAERLRQAGLEVTEENVVTSALTTATLAADRAPGCAAFIIGTDAFRDEVTNAGLRILSTDDDGKADLVLIGGDQDFGYAELRSAITAVIGGAALIASNRDRTLPMPDGLWPGTGAIVAAVEYSTGVSAEIGGKPERHLFDEALGRLEGAKRPVMIGDRLDSDIAGAQGAGLETILVLSGVATVEELEGSDVKPDHVVGSLAELSAQRT